MSQSRDEDFDTKSEEKSRRHSSDRRAQTQAVEEDHRSADRRTNKPGLAGLIGAILRGL
jgi:hypothetical protein